VIKQFGVGDHNARNQRSQSLEYAFLSVQHPSEDLIPNDGTPASTLNRDLELLGLDGNTFMQNRTLPRGSNWPSNLGGNALGAPKPATIGIRRVNGGPFIPGGDLE